MRERELKQKRRFISSNTAKSLPMRERELKPRPLVVIAGIVGRSPCGSVN